MTADVPELESVEHTDLGKSAWNADATAADGQVAKFVPLRALSTGRLPTPPGQLIGRTWELDAIRHCLINEERRLLTLWGPAGIGKTRLALAAATDPQVRAAFKDGVVFADLAPLCEATQVMRAIGEAVGIPDAPQAQLLRQLESLLGERRILLILDNLEHVLECAPQLVPLLVSCPGLMILGTSRAALQLRWEHAFPIAQLAVPASNFPKDAATAASYAGIVLFVERARAARPGFQLTDANASVVAELCARLDGLPLALELAAARTKGLPLLVLLKRLEDRLGLLHSGAPDLPPRQQTLRRALMWSYDLLNADQQAVFRRLGVFVGGCSPEVAEALCTDVQLGSDVLEALAVLVRHSLVRLEEAPGGQPRYTMLNTVRDYAVEQLALSAEADELRQHHAAYFASVVHEADAQLSGPEQVEWLEFLEREHGNLQAVLRWAIAERQAAYGLDLAAALQRFWSIRGHLTEGRSWLKQLLAMAQADEATAAQARGFGAAGWLAEAQGDYPEAKSLQEQSLELSREVGYDVGIANALRHLGVLAQYAEEPLTARARFEESLAICGVIGFSNGTLRVLQDLGNLCLDQGDLAGARDYFDRSLSMRPEVLDLRGIALALFGRARVALSDGDLVLARSHLEEALGMLRKLGDHQSIASVLELFACLAARRGGTARALRLVGASESLRTSAGADPHPYWRTDLEAHHKAIRAELGQAASAAARAVGRSMALDQAIQLCLEDETLARASDCPSEVLVNGFLEEFTRREREVIALAVRGWSNRQIANDLVISERTAEGHIHNILGKLQLESRAQLVAWGARLGLVMTEVVASSRSLAS